MALNDVSRVSGYETSRPVPPPSRSSHAGVGNAPGRSEDQPRPVTVRSSESRARTMITSCIGRRFASGTALLERPGTLFGHRTRKLSPSITITSPSRKARNGV